MPPKTAVATKDGPKIEVKTSPLKKIVVKKIVKKLAPASGKIKKIPIKGGSKGCTAVIKSAPSVPTVAPSADGRYQLDAVTSRVLERELSALMDHAMGDLLEPESNADEAQDEIKRRQISAGASLKNAIGLDATTRLLNVHNPLSVELRFSSVPSLPSLRWLLARIGVPRYAAQPLNEAGVFVARVNSFAHMDRLLKVGSLTFGKINTTDVMKVTIKPHIRVFTDCPVNVNTIYKEKAIEENKGHLGTARDKSINTINVKAENTQTNPNEKATNSGVKMQPKTSEDRASGSKTQPKEVKEQNSGVKSHSTVAEKKAGLGKTPTPVNNYTNERPNKKVKASEPEVKAQNMQAPIATPGSNVPNVKAHNNTKQNAVDVKPVQTPGKTVNQLKTVVKAQNVQAPKATPSSNVQNVKAQSNAKQNAVDVKKPCQTPGKTVNQLKTVVKAQNVQAPKATPSSNVPNVKAQSNAKQNAVDVKPVKTPGKTVNQPKTLVKSQNVQAPKATPSSNVPNVKAQSNTKPNAPVKTLRKTVNQQKTGVVTRKVQETQKKENDYDELDDKDILTLISQGIVVDECDSGDDSMTARLVIDECGSDDD